MEDMMDPQNTGKLPSMIEPAETNGDISFF